MDVQKAIKEMSRSHEVRATMYLNEDGVSGLFSQTLPGITSIVSKREKSGELSGGVRQFLLAKIALKHGTDQATEFDAVLKAMLLEYKERKEENLIDLRVGKGRARLIPVVCWRGSYLPTRRASAR